MIILRALVCRTDTLPMPGMTKPSFALAYAKLAIASMAALAWTFEISAASATAAIVAVLVIFAICFLLWLSGLRDVSRCELRAVKGHAPLFRKGKTMYWPKRYSQFPLFFQHKLDLTALSNTIARVRAL